MEKWQNRIYRGLGGGRKDNDRQPPGCEPIQAGQSIFWKKFIEKTAGCVRLFIVKDIHNPDPVFNNLVTQRGEIGDFFINLGDMQVKYFDELRSYSIKFLLMNIEMFGKFLHFLQRYSQFFQFKDKFQSQDIVLIVGTGAAAEPFR